MANTAGHGIVSLFNDKPGDIRVLRNMVMQAASRKQ
jgi:hypothetical protein